MTKQYKENNNIKKTTNPYDAIVAVAYLFPTCSTLILTFCPTFAFLTNTTKPCTLAIPSPCLLISVTSTSYSLPTSNTAVGLPDRELYPKLLLLLLLPPL